MVISSLPKTLFFLALMFVASMNCFNIVQQPSLGRPFGLETGNLNDKNAVARLRNDTGAQTSEQGWKSEGPLDMAQRQKIAEVERSSDAVTFNIVRSDTTLFMSHSNVRLNPAAASAKCRSLNGELASLTSLRKLKIVEENSGGDWYWTSGKKNMAPNEWRWGTGELIRPSAREFITSGPHSWDCLRHYYGPFYPYSCGSTYTSRFACESDGLKPPNDEFFAFPLKTTFILVQHSKISYSEAEADCAKRGPNATLATPTRFKELDLIDKSMGNLNNLWLGGKRDEVYRKGKWVTGEPIVANLRKWGGSKCLLYYDKEFFVWFDCRGVEGDKWSDGYVCQIDE